MKKIVMRMRKSILPACVALMLAFGCITPTTLVAQAEVYSLRKNNFNQGWSFRLGSYPQAVNNTFDDSNWRVLNLPHDWSIENEAAQAAGNAVGPFSKNSIGRDATGNTVGGEGWYRKRFTLTPDNAKKRQVLHFEGAYNQAELFVNGKKVYENPYGYMTFRCDITDYCKPAGEENVITVRVRNEGKNSRWYAGSGIYRHVWLVQTEATHLDEWATAIRTESLTDNQALISVSSEVLGTLPKSGTPLQMELTLLSPQGKKLSTQTATLSPKAGITPEVNFKSFIAKPQLWSPDTPILYSAQITLKEGKKKLDEITIPFGIRTLEIGRAHV